jgi:amino-acid N-acetyltransferase
LAGNSYQPPSNSWRLRPAVEADFVAIRNLIRQVHINLMGLDWRRFWIAVNQHNELVGCGQIKSHTGGIDELASIAVVPEWRGQGLARDLIEKLLHEHPARLYLTCRERLGGLYEKFGFRKVEKEDMPPYYRRIVRLVGLMKTTRLLDEDIWVMVREESQCIERSPERTA